MRIFKTMEQAIANKLPVIPVFKSSMNKYFYSLLQHGKSLIVIVQSLNPAYIYIVCHNISNSLLRLPESDFAKEKRPQK